MTDLVLIDGSSYLYRAYYAIKGLANSDGEPTGTLKETAAALVRSVVPVATSADFERAARWAAQSLNRHGVTSLKDAYAGRPALQAYRALEDRGDSIEVTLQGRLEMGPFRLGKVIVGVSDLQQQRARGDLHFRMFGDVSLVPNIIRRSHLLEEELF